MLQVNFSQLKPISTLPRKYSDYVKQVEKEGVVVFVKKSRPKVVLLDFAVWEKLEGIRRLMEEKEALRTIRQSEREIKKGSFLKIDSLEELC